MTKIKSLFAAFAFALLSTATFAYTPTTLDDLRSEIADHLSSIDISQMAIESQTLQVKFVVNEENELIVLSVDDKKLDNTIKNKLNYQKLSTEGVEKNTVITVPITFKKV